LSFAALRTIPALSLAALRTGRPFALTTLSARLAFATRLIGLLRAWAELGLGAFIGARLVKITTRLETAFRTLSANSFPAEILAWL
jgi:hypothetical protein